MRARFLVSGIALAAFAATLMMSGWPGHPFTAAHPPAPAVPAVPQPAGGRSEMPSAPGSGEAAASGGDNAAVVPAPAGTKEGNQAPQPPLPDPSALPSYEKDQAARNAQALGSARSR